MNYDIIGSYTSQGLTPGLGVGGIWLPQWVGLHLLALPHNSQQLGVAGLDKTTLKGPALSVPQHA